VFLLGIFWQRINSKGAMTALVGGFTLGMLRLITELNKSHLSGFLYDFANVNFLYFAVYSFIGCLALIIVVSLFTKRPSAEQIRGLTYSTTVAEDKTASRASWDYRDVIHSLVILVIIALVLIYFTG